MRSPSRTYEEDPITESLLEMHFHSALVELFERAFEAKVLKIYKPSTNREVWLGYDQAWVRTELTQREFEDHLAASLHGGPPFPERFIGYFLQFKRVERMVRRSRFTPANFPDEYYRAELSTSVNPRTQASQHATLLRLQQFEASDVNYACPMLFGPDAMYDKPDLDRLRLVPLRGAPTYADNDRHFIAFRAQVDPAPVWCSDPIGAESTTVSEWMFSNGGPKAGNGRDMIALVRRYLEVAATKNGVPVEEASVQALTIIEFEAVPYGTGRGFGR